MERGRGPQDRRIGQLLTGGAPRHAVLTGAPGAGKTTLLDAAGAAGIRTSPEVARELLRQPGGMALRETDPLLFAEAMLDAHLREYQRFSGEVQPVMFDRGFPDVVGFYDLTGQAIPPRLDQVCRTIRYHGPILRAAPWAEIYRQDAERIQTWEEAVESDRAIIAAWRRYGYDVIDLPLAGVEERLSVVRSLLQLPA